MSQMGWAYMRSPDPVITTERTLERAALRWTRHPSAGSRGTAGQPRPAPAVTSWIIRSSRPPENGLGKKRSAACGRYPKVPQPTADEHNAD